ncbi:MAG: RNA polymerase factor sigma-54 [Calditrichales bacterium]|nr:MAG: RNA polymerase factor sigma-54 [Calditrichales bacterium]
MIQLSQSMRLEQRLSPQQILLSTLLQLPLLSLEQKIQMELELNPVLEEGLEEDLDMDSESIDSSDEEQAEVEKELELTDPEDQNSDLDKDELKEAQDDTDWDEMINDEESYDYRLPRDKNDEDFERPEVVINSMTDYLMDQLNYLRLSESERDIGEYLIWIIKDDGYLDESVSTTTIAEIFECAPGTVESILKKIHKFEPVGVGARNLQECLLAQLEEIDPLPELAIRVLRDHFEDFKNKRFDNIISALNLETERLREVIEIISKLNPKPGAGLYDSKHNYIIPDFIVEKVDGEFIVTLNDWNIPPLRISKTYKQLLQKKNNTDKETKQYIRKKMDSAKWFINSIYQRKMTMLNVMQALIEKQYDFFDKGPAFIKPLIMREIAEIINMDISTISRVANGKYVQTDHGIFELKYFFTERIQTDDGEEVSTRQVRTRITEMVAKEDPSKPLSDEKISQILTKEGFPVARRTVAKYREQIDIPVARLRKKL